MLTVVSTNIIALKWQHSGWWLSFTPCFLGTHTSSRLPLFIKFFLTNVFFLRCSRHPIRTQASLVHPGATLPFNSCICLVKFCMTLNFGQFNLCLLIAKGTAHSLVHWDLSQNTLGAPRQAAPKYTSMAYSLSCKVTWETAFGEKWYLKKKILTTFFPLKQEINLPYELILLIQGEQKAFLSTVREFNSERESLYKTFGTSAGPCLVTSGIPSLADIHVYKLIFSPPVNLCCTNY